MSKKAYRNKIFMPLEAKIVVPNNLRFYIRLAETYINIQPI